MPERDIVGMMTGTSCDGCDAALVRLGDLGPPTVLNTVSRGLGELGPALRRIADQGATTTGELAELGRALALVHIHCVRELIGDGPRPDLVAVHGQTLFHRPPLSLQFLPLPILAHELGTTVVGDLRGADLAAGGQGAPITPLADAVCYPGDGPRAVVNLGGFINITLLDGNTVVGGRDLCVGNQLLDRLARMLLGKPYDLDGSVAGSGQADAQACTELGVTLRSQDRGRSLGTGDELLPWVERWGESLTPADVLASACQGLAGAISSKLLAEIPRPEAVVIAGGGCHNTALVQALDKFLAPVVLKRSEDYGLPTSHREAVAMAVLGDYCQRRIPITLPIVTGVGTAPVAGVWAYP